jgi:cytoskeletal protein RodZ
MAAAVKFTRRTLPQKEGLGEKLAKKRISLGLDIKDIEKAIRIRWKYIESIENGRYDNLPPDVYVRGFIRNYAAYLKLDPDKVMKLYERERGLIENVKKAKAGTAKAKPFEKAKLVITPKTLTLGGIVAGSLLILIYIGWQVSILTAPPRLTVNSPKDNVNISSSSTTVDGTTDNGATVTINDVEIGTDQAGNFKEKISLQNGVNVIHIKSQNKLGKYTEQTKTIVAQTTPDAVATAAGAIELKLVIGPRSASISVEVDGKKLSEKPTVVVSGVTQTYKAVNNIKITTNDGGTVQATYNGQTVGPLGKDSETVNREFTKDMKIK